MKLVFVRMFIGLMALFPFSAFGDEQGKVTTETWDAAAAAAANPRGADVFRRCTACHGLEGQGKQSIAAPAIAGMPEWYVVEQLHKFKKGVRGTHPKDVAGMRMRPMAKTLGTDADITAVAKYVAGMPVAPMKSYIEGNALAGEKHYQVCVTCHQKDGSGNKTLKAPPLSNQSDWYLYTQLRNFKGGIRGSNPTVDPTGAQMPAMARLLTDDQAVKDVVAYIKTLQ